MSDEHPLKDSWWLSPKYGPTLLCKHVGHEVENMVRSTVAFYSGIEPLTPIQDSVLTRARVILDFISGKRTYSNANFYASQIIKEDKHCANILSNVSKEIKSDKQDTNGNYMHWYFFISSRLQHIGFSRESINDHDQWPNSVEGTEKKHESLLELSDYVLDNLEIISPCLQDGFQNVMDKIIIRGREYLASSGKIDNIKPCDIIKDLELTPIPYTDSSTDQ